MLHASGLIMACRALDLTPVLGNAMNANELLELLKVIEHTNFSRFPDWMANRVKVGQHFLGRESAGADYVFYFSTGSVSLLTKSL